VADQDHTQGRTLSRYRLLEEVGQGGMAVVYKGLDTTLNREVAVKVLHPHLAGLPESRARLQREAHAVAKLRHENILEIFDYSGPDSSESFIVTEFIHGTTLKSFLAEHPLPFAEVAEMLASEVARALEHAHALGVIHRDIKPENVMIRDDGLVKLMDFGIAQIVDKERMTVTGQLLGSPAYMAPEHVEGKPLDFRTDVFAVGILLYQLATGQLPFRGKNPHEVLKKIAECKYTPAEQVSPRVGARLSRVIARALQKEPGDRFADVAPLRAELLADLADAGIADPRKELQAFFAAPERWAKDYRPRLVDALAKRGQELARGGRTAAALELWSRALAVEPKSAELRALVEGVAARRRAGRLAIGLAGVAALAGAIAIWGTLGVRALHHRRPPATPQPAPHASDLVPALIAPPPVEKSPDPIAPSEVEKPAPARKHVQRPKPVATPPRVVEIVPIPAKVHVFIDGEDKGMLTDGRYPLADGKHEVRLENELCAPLTFAVDPSQSSKYPQRLAWRPAQLVIKTTPADADVVLEGGLVASGGAALPIPINPLSEDGRREVRVKVSAAGYHSKELTVAVRAAEKAERTVTLEKLGANE
jgi:serine/threonine-protein kinase